MTIQNAASAVRRASGCLFGLAFGDSLGANTEFLSVPEILLKYTQGPQELETPLARVTDDTQMMLAVGEALCQAEQPYTVKTLEDPLRDAFIAWRESPDNNRAPGITCCQACDYLACGLPWYKATIARSKGCGANMRVAPVGLLPLGVNGLTAETRAAIAQFQGGLTHGHPTALAASDLTAYVVADLLADGDPATLPERLLEYAHSQRTVYHMDWLTRLWQRSSYETPAEFIAVGWDECIRVLERLQHALRLSQPPLDPCEATGAGWVAEEALATALYCFLLFPDDAVHAIRRAALSSGDSDSLACLTGAFAGAHLGRAAWPQSWFERIEYADRLQRLGEQWD